MLSNVPHQFPVIKYLKDTMQSVSLNKIRVTACDIA